MEHFFFFSVSAVLQFIITQVENLHLANRKLHFEKNNYTKGNHENIAF